MGNGLAGSADPAPAVLLKVASLRQLVGWLSADITVLEQVTADLLAGHDGYRAVRELPGIGPVPGAVIVAEIGDVTRFRHPSRLCSWAGLTARHYESDSKVVRGRITKQGSPVLRWALIEAIQRTPDGTPIRQAMRSWPGTSRRGDSPGQAGVSGLGSGMCRNIHIARRGRGWHLQFDADELGTRRSTATSVDSSVICIAYS